MKRLTKSIITFRINCTKMNKTDKNRELLQRLLTGDKTILLSKEALEQQLQEAISDIRQMKLTKAWKLLSEKIIPKAAEEELITEIIIELRKKD